MIEQLKIYISDSLDPYQNLATEKYLFDTVEEKVCILFLWQNQNTVVIGKNQNPWAECNCALIKEENVKLARRLSGGGAVFHDTGNLNFTFLCRENNYDLNKQMQVVKTACSKSGIAAELSGRNDILADGRKFSGNAFYSSQGRSYHHGTILVSGNMESMSRYLTPGKAKLQSKGVKSVKSRTINLAELSPLLTCKKMAEYMASAFGEVYGLQPVYIEALPREEICALAEKYSSWEYLYAVAIPFTFSCEEQFSWGGICLQIEVKKGIITNVRLYTDSMDWTLPERIEKAFVGLPFKFSQMKEALYAHLPHSIAADFSQMLRKQEI